jgi:hypothetical protein
MIVRNFASFLEACLQPQIGTWQIRKHLKVDDDDDDDDDDVDDDDEVFLLAQIYHHNSSSQHRTFSSSKSLAHSLERKETISRTRRSKETQYRRSSGVEEAPQETENQAGGRGGTGREREREREERKSREMRNQTLEKIR